MNKYRQEIYNRADILLNKTIAEQILCANCNWIKKVERNEVRRHIKLT